VVEQELALLFRLHSFGNEGGGFFISPDQSGFWFAAY
jgi:hypothetical protein